MISKYRNFIVNRKNRLDTDSGSLSHWFLDRKVYYYEFGSRGKSFHLKKQS